MDARFIALFCLLFLGLGIFNFYLGIKRTRREAQKDRTPWYKQVNILTGLEYMLLTIAFLLGLTIAYGWIPASWRSIVLPLYVVILILSGLLAGVVIYQGYKKQRRLSAVHASTVVAENDDEPLTKMHLSEQEAEIRQRRRERRRKAAEARRRRSGRA